MLSEALIERILTTLAGATVGLVGDLFLDRYLDIDPALDEPSIETGLTAYQVVGVRGYPGALGTVLNNLAALGAGSLVPLSVIGDDGEGYELRQALRRMPRVDPSRLVVSPERRTPTYTKPMHGGTELSRLDIKNRTPTPAHLQDAILAHLAEMVAGVDALIVLDQVSEAECGVVTGRVRRALTEFAARHPGVFILADSREQIGEFRGVAVKPNEAECLRALSRAGRDLSGATFAGREAELMRLVGGTVFCTRGAAGIRVVPYRAGSDGAIGEEVPPYPVLGPTDICGAGDSCSAGIAAATLGGATPGEAAAFGNLVASITVRQLGTTGTATPAMVRARWAEVRPSRR